MRKLILTFVFAAGFMLPVSACTNLIVTKGASTNGSNMCTYAADSHQLYGALHYMPAADYPAGSYREIRDWDSGKLLGRIPQAAHVYSVIFKLSYKLFSGKAAADAAAYRFYAERLAREAYVYPLAAADKKLLIRSVRFVL